MNVNKRIVFFRMFFFLSIWFSRIHCLRREANIVMDAKWLLPSTRPKAQIIIINSWFPCSGWIWNVCGMLQFIGEILYLQTATEWCSLAGPSHAKGFAF